MFTIYNYGRSHKPPLAYAFIPAFERIAKQNRSDASQNHHSKRLVRTTCVSCLLTVTL